MTDRLDVIAAFADGELVAGDELEAALADAAGRAYLIDVLALRGLIENRRTDHVRQGYGGSPKLAATGTSVVGGQTGAKRTLWFSSIAALVLVGVAGGYIAGRQQNPVTNPVRDEGTASPAAVVPAPAPTHVIRMENGVNWNEKAGGN